MRSTFGPPLKNLPRNIHPFIFLYEDSSCTQGCWSLSLTQGEGWEKCMAICTQTDTHRQIKVAISPNVQFFGLQDEARVLGRNMQTHGRHAKSAQAPGPGTKPATFFPGRQNRWAGNRLIHFYDGSLKWLQIMPQLRCQDDLIMTTDD